ncbi:type I polyketide synthase [Trinickia sp. LjRoot230]|uniref:type I polyketide synthase n=1 Tax=Trinickia sp. LjRoot230 TaxID=3342288 RepID=UPI003ED05F5A
MRNDAAGPRNESARDHGHAPAAAIIGAACRFPGADSIDEYWQLLLAGRAVAADPDAERVDLWSALSDARLASRVSTLKGGYLRDIAGFDADHFGIAPREAAKLDPQQRLLLSVTHDALEDAGLTRAALRAMSVGVFIGAGSNDHMMLASRSRDTIDAYHGIGNSHSLLANRISYYYNLKGPSFTVDTACSSSLSALHMAQLALAHDDIDLAIVGGVNIIVSPDLTLAFSQAGMLSPSGRCNTFSAHADGYGRAEGVGVIVLAAAGSPLLADAQPRCLILSAAVNQDGRSNGITAPNGVSQREVICAAMKRAGVGPTDIAYVETHGTGTKLGDAIEFNALRDVFAAEPSARCHVGSAKANVGHMEAAAGMGGLIKAMLMLEHRTIVAHAVEPPYNEFIDQARGRLQITQSSLPLREGGCIGVSSFGFGGSNAHAILARAPGRRVDDEVREQHPALLLLSTHDAQLAQADARRLADQIEAGRVPLSGVASALAYRRDALRHRTAIVAADRESAIRQLRALDVAHVHASRPHAPRVAFVFTGQGSQYAGMGAQLYACNAVFRDAYDECATHIERHSGFGINALLHGGEAGAERMLADTHLAQLALFCLEHALARLLMSAGIEPVAMIGHSLGELVAQAVAGMFDLGDAVALVHERARLMQAHGPAGAMTSVFATEASVRSLIAHSRLPVHLCAVNGATSVTISGEQSAIESFEATLAAQSILARRLPSRHAFHTPGLGTAAQALGAFTRSIAARPARVPVVSNLDGTLLDTLSPGSDYWSRQLLAPVAFAQGIDTLIAQKIDVFVELGPDRSLSKLISRDHRAAGVDAFSLLQRGHDDVTECLTAFGRLFACGCDLKLDAIVPRTAYASLPARTLRSQRFWAFAQATQVDAEKAAHVSTSRPSQTNSSPLPSTQRSVVALQLDVMQSQLALLASKRAQPAQSKEDSHA